MASTFAFTRDVFTWPKARSTDEIKPQKHIRPQKRLRAERIPLNDVRQHATAQSLVPSIVDGLSAETRELPALLLWNDRGLSLFDAVLESPDYYPATREWSLLHNVVHKIAHTISSGDRLIELGAGNMKKTALVLHTLQAQRKHIQYIACDVDRTALRRCLRELQSLFPVATSTIRIQGLLGTYEDCAAWLKSNNSNSNSRTTLMWLGNSMANFTPYEASEYIRSFLSSGSSLIVGLDGSQDLREIAQSYEAQSNREFVLNGLVHANELLGTDVFNVNDWEFMGKWNPEHWMHEAFYVSRKDVTVSVAGEEYHFKRGETMRSIRSGKWPKGKVLDICKNAGGSVIESWMNDDESYGIYSLRGNYSHDGQYWAARQ